LRLAHARSKLSNNQLGSHYGISIDEFNLVFAGVKSEVIKDE
jgi:hypothetical protein